MKSDVLAFHGRKFTPSTLPMAYVTPDLAITYGSNKGVIGEVKISFPLDESHWLEDLKQVMNYDDDLIGWPTPDEKCENYDIVLLTHISRSKQIKTFIEQHPEIKFKKPFIIVEFGKVVQTNEFFYFCSISGEASDDTVKEKLKKSVMMPMIAFAGDYSRIKLCDHMPPIPYLLDLIWTNIVLQKVPDLGKVRKNQKIDVSLKVDEIIDSLHKYYSFNAIHGTHSERQSKIPHKEWIVQACDKLVQIGEARWLDPKTKDTIEVFFKLYDDVLNHFLTECSRIETSQINLL